MDLELTAGASVGLCMVRVDGPVKVCGEAEFAGDVQPPGAAWAALVTSPVARGLLRRLDAAAARRAAGVLAVLTHENCADAVREVKHMMAGGWANSTLRPLASPEIHYAGQIVAVVVAETLEQAQWAAGLVQLDVAATAPRARLSEVPSRPLAELQPEHQERHCGDFEKGWSEAALRVDGRYSTPVQHHNPMELPSCTCFWNGSKLTIHEPARGIGTVRAGVAEQLGLSPADVRVIARFLGGHFGAKFALSQFTALAALASRRVKRSVRLFVSRRDNFTVANHRTETEHHLRLGADAAGRFVALSHTATTASSYFDSFAMAGADVTSALYACPHVVTLEKLGRVDRNTPGPMRAPPEVPFMFALECAVDELAWGLHMDPVELRRRNDTLADPVTGKRFTTRPLMRCFDAAAARFGWSAARSAAVRSRLDDGWWVGVGCAAAARPVKIGAAELRLTLTTAGRATVEVAHHEIGNGLYTLLALTAAEKLGIAADQVTVRLGDTDLPAGGLSGGSATTTTLANALAEACPLLLAAQPDAQGTRSLTHGFVPPGAPENTLQSLRQGKMKLVTAPSSALAWSFGAHFVEVRVHAVSGEVRVARHVGAFAAGRIVNPLLARSQLLGGMVWGQSSALLEATDVDPRTGCYVNADLADYLLPTCADVGELEAIMVDDHDPEVNPEGVKGLGEIGIIGVDAAVANAVYHATGVRVRDLPIRLEQLLI